MHKLELFLENETRKIPWDFDIQTDPLMLIRRLDIVLIKKNLSSGRFCHSSEPPSKKKKNKKKKIDKYLKLAWEQKTNKQNKNKKKVEDEGDDDIRCSCCSWIGPLWLLKGTERIGNQGKNRDHLDHSSKKIG